MPEIDRRPASSGAAPLVGAMAALTALAAVFSDQQPTPERAGDVLVLAGLGIAVAFAGSRAHPWALVVIAGVAAGATTGPAAVVAWIALVTVVVLVARRSRPETLHIAGTVIAPVAYLCLLQQTSYGFHGAPLLLGSAAVGVVLASGYRGAAPVARLRTRQVLAVTAGLAIIVIGGFALSVVLVTGHLADGADAAQRALDAARAGNTSAASAEVDVAEDHFRTADERLSAWWAQPARYLPGVGQQVVAMAALTEEGRRVSSSGDVIESVSDYRSLKYRSGRIDLAKVRALADPVGEAIEDLDASAARLDRLDRSWLLPPLASKARSFHDQVASAADDAATAHAVLEVLPGLLGGDGDRHYFVAFLTPAEARGLGGFLGNYGELEAVDGKVRMVRSGAIAEIEPPVKDVRTLDGPAEYLARYGRFDPADYLRDSPMSPHLPFVADVMSQLYPQAGGPEIDGVITMDPFALAALLELTGPIEVPGYDRVLTSENLAEITLVQQYLDFDDRNQERKDLLVDATELAFDRLLEGDLPSPGRLIEVLGPMVRERRLMLWSPEQAEEALFTHMGADGRMPEAGGGDAFLLAHQNYGNSKIDAYLQRAVDYRASVDEASGRVSATATVTLRNDAPATGLPAYVIGNSRGAPSGTNLMNLTVFSALGLDSATVDGAPVTSGIGTEAGLNAYDLAISIPPGATVRIVVRLSGGVDLRQGPYRLQLAPQGQVNPDEMQVMVGGAPALRCSPGGQPLPEDWELTETVAVGAPGCDASN